MDSKLERNSLMMAILVAVTVSIGGLVEIVPLVFYHTPAQANSKWDVKPRTALEQAGFDLYIREGCFNCHSQQVRPIRTETERYGDYSRETESQHDRPFQWGSKRTGPDLSRLGGKYPDSWHVEHMRNPAKMAPGSIMPAYPWLEKTPLDTSDIQARLKALRIAGVPYSDAEIESAPTQLMNKTELDAMIAYMQSIGKAAKE